MASHGDNTGLTMAVMYFNEQAGTWYLRQVQRPFQGRHFQDALTPIKDELSEFIDVTIYQHMLTTDKTFEMHKGDVAGIPSHCNEVRMGLGWECKRDLDLDASVMAVSRNNTIEYCCYYKDLVKPGMRHTGDNLTGEGAGDDEVIILYLDQIPAHVEQLYLTVHCFNSATGFQEVYDAFVRMFLPNGHELLYYPLDGALRSRGLIFCKLFRNKATGSTGPTTKWSVEALGWGCDGETVMAPQTRRVVLGQQKPYKFSGKALRTGKSRGSRTQGGGGCCCTIM